MLSVRNTGEAGEKPLRKRVERVASRLFHNHALACGCLKAEERFILIFYGVVLVLTAVSTTVFFPVCPPLVAIRFSANVQHVSSSLFSSHNSGSPEEIAQEAERSRRDHTRRLERARPADPTEMATSQAAAGTVDSKYE
jgi:hypothetical protein